MKLSDCCFRAVFTITSKKVENSYQNFKFECVSYKCSHCSLQWIYYNFIKRLMVAVEQLGNQEIMSLVVNTFWKEPNED